MFSLMMKIDSSTIWQVIEQGEKSSLEFKSQKPRAEQIAVNSLPLQIKTAGYC